MRKNTRKNKDEYIAEHDGHDVVALIRDLNESEDGDDIDEIIDKLEKLGVIIDRDVYFSEDTLESKEPSGMSIIVPIAVSFKEVNAIVEAESMTMDERVKEWREIKKKQAVMLSVGKMMAERIKDLEDEMLPIIKHQENQQDVIDSAIVEFKSAATKGVKYKQVVEKALEISNSKQQAILTEFIDSVTNRGVSEKIAIADPELDIFLKSLKDVDPDDILSKLGSIDRIPKNILNKKKREADLQEGITDKIKSGFKAVAGAIKKAFTSLKNKIKSGDKSTHALVDAVASE